MGKVRKATVLQGSLGPESCSVRLSVSQARDMPRDRGMTNAVLCRMKLADDDSDDEGGWDADGDAPTLGELPVLPQVEEAHKPPWQLSGGCCAVCWAGVCMARST